jgi:hypothetical protein
MTAAATAAYIRDHARIDALVRGHDTTVTIVAMGYEGVRRRSRTSAAAITWNISWAARAGLKTRPLHSRR